MSFASFVKVLKRDALGNVVFGPDGNPIEGIGVNPIKPHVRGYWLVGETPAGAALLVLAASGTGELEFLIDSQGHFDWVYLIGVSTGNYRIEFFDPGKSRDLQNKPVHSALIVGSAQRPFRLPEPYFFNVGDSQRNLIAKLRDISGAQNTVRLLVYGRRIYHKEAPPDVAIDLNRRFGQGERTYSYFLVPLEYDSTGAPTAVAANGTATFTFEMDSNADTEIQKLMASSTGAFTFTIRERSTNRLLMNDVVHSDQGWGNAEFPFLEADTYLLERQKQLIVNVTDISGAENTINLAMAGRRLVLVP